jgi:hypothetical protein
MKTLLVTLLALGLVIFGVFHFLFMLVNNPTDPAVTYPLVFGFAGFVIGSLIDLKARQ